jgi:hypothetical protein
MPVHVFVLFGELHPSRMTKPCGLREREGREGVGKRERVRGRERERESGRVRETERE